MDGGACGLGPASRFVTGDLWPRARLLERILHFVADGRAPSKGYALLLTTGGTNPVHRGHVQLLHQAEQCLQKQGFAVLGAWLSPSHDLYLQPKARHLGTIGLSDKFRLEVARRATESDPLVAVGQWECAQEGYWPDYPEVAEALQAELGDGIQEFEQLPGWSKGSSVTVFYACGTDHAEKCGLYRRGLNRPGTGLVVVPRLGDPVGKEKPDSLVFVAEPAEGAVASFSSTKVRKAIVENDAAYLSEALSPEGAAFLLKPEDWEQEHFESDFLKLF